MSYTPEISKLLSEGGKLYASKEYELASEKYGEACERFQNDNDRDDPDLLLLYGKALFQNGVSRSEVFGGNEESNEQKEENSDAEEDDDNFHFHEDGPLAEADDADDEEPDNEGPKYENDDADHHSDIDGKEGEAEDQVSQSDFEIAWEILDLARSLFEKEIELFQDEGKKLTVPYLKDDKESSSNQFIILTKKISETYDILGEVSLEAENFQQSALDLAKALELREKLYNFKSSALISESHYKLSLALEFCIEDPDSRTKAAEQMRLAIESVKARNEKESAEEKRKDNEELLQDLDVRFQDLKKDPTEELKEEQLDIIKGILGEATPEKTSSSSNSGGAIKSEVKNQVADLTSIVRKRKSKEGGLDSKKSKK